MGDAGQPLWQHVVSLVLSVGTAAAGIVFAWKVLRDQSSERARTIRRDYSRTRAVTRDLRRGRDVPESDRPLAQAVVDGTRASWQLSVLMGVLSASLAFTGATRPGGLPWLSYGAAVIGLLAAAVGVVTTRSIRRGGERVGLHPGGGDA